MDENDYSINDFWNSFGGFSITLDGFKTIFSSHEFYNMVKATSFLLNTLYWLEGKHTDWFNDYSNVKELSIEYGLRAKLTLQYSNSTELTISYFSEELSYERRRGDRFFKGIVLDKKEWMEACRTALNEYFTVLLQVIQNNPEDNTSRIMQKYHNIWKLVERPSN